MNMAARIAVLTTERKKFLKERLGRVCNEQRVYGYPAQPPVKLAKSFKVIRAEQDLKRFGRLLNAAQKIVKGYDARCTNATKAREQRKRAMRDECEKAILFGTPQEAMDMLDKFERAKF